MNIVAFPILVPFLTLIVLFFVKQTKAVRVIAISANLLILAGNIFIFSRVITNDILVLQSGDWKAPFGITLVIDYFSAIMLLTASVLSLSICIYANKFTLNKPNYERFYQFFFTLLMGVNGAFITGDTFNLYVWFEVMLLSSFVLITMGGKKEQLEGGIKYLAVNLIGSLLFLAGLGLLYGKTGTLNMAHLAHILQHDDRSLLMNTSAMLFFVAFGIKAAVFPLFFWLPASYHTPNISVTALFAGLLTKVGVYALIRFFTLFFVQDQHFWHQLVLIIAGLTMVIGGMAASIYYDTRKILSYHIISQIGYMIMGLGIYTPLGIAGAIYFTVHNMFAKTNTFLVSGIIAKVQGTYDLKRVGGLFKSHPVLAVLFIIPAFALAGIPPLSGFFGKFMLLKAGFDEQYYFITGVAVFTGMLTLYSMIKIWNEAFMKKTVLPNLYNNKYHLTANVILPSVILALCSIAMGVFASPVYNIVHKAAEQLLQPSVYINTILKI